MTTVIRALFTHSWSTTTCRLTLAQHSATRSSRLTTLNRAGHILRRCHIASCSTVGNQQSHRLLYHQFHTHTRHGSLEKQTAMEALVRSMVKFLILALVNMDRPTKGASYDLVHRLLLSTATSLKGTSTSFSLHTTLRKTHV